MSENTPPESIQTISFKAETRQLLDILVHSLYTEREVFLRELISNAADALTKIHFEMLTNHDVLDPDAELAIRIYPNKEQNSLTITDTGIGMTREELIENLGTIAHSGVKDFLNAVQQKDVNMSELIGQFGVGFYSSFMVAESIRVTSRSYRLGAPAATWISTGAETFTIEPAEKSDRGTSIYLKLNNDSTEFTEEYRLRQIIRRHNDYIPFPIYIGDDKEPANHQTALWRQQPRQVNEQQYLDFYKQLTLDPEKPFTHIHISVDAPVQVYALLYIPPTPERNVFSPRRQDGLKLYARKVLIQEYCQDLLSQFLRPIQGVVDSEDIPLNISRESIQSNKILAQLKNLLTSKIIENLKNISQEKPDEYEKFWKSYAQVIKEGIATDYDNYEVLLPLLRFHTLKNIEKWSSLEDYIKELKPGQEKIYYIMGDDIHSVVHSPHLEVFRHNGYDVLLMTDPIDPFMLLRLNKYQKYDISNVSIENIKPNEEKKDEKSETEDKENKQIDTQKLIELFKTQLGDKVADVRITDRLIESPARLVDKEGAIPQEMQRVYHYLKKEYDTPQKILEINPKHLLLTLLDTHTADQHLTSSIIQQIYEDALLIEGLHLNPASMIQRIQDIMEAALGKQ